jgi:hypothetical protein
MYEDSQTAPLLSGIRYSALSLACPFFCACSISAGSRLLFLFGIFAETSSWDLRTSSSTSRRDKASKLSSNTHLYLPTYGAGPIPPLDELGKFFRSTFEAEPLRDRAQAHHRKGLSTYFGTELIFPVQILFRSEKRQAELSQENRHSLLYHLNPIYCSRIETRRRSRCKPGSLAIQI